MGRPRNWYHCSSRNHGPEFTAVRRTPIHAAKSEPPVPRLCVCRSIAGCFAAAIFDDQKPVYVYRTAKPTRAVQPREVWDQVVTREKWLIPPVRMKLVAIINGLTVGKAQEDVRFYHQMTRLNSDICIRVAQLSIAIDVLGAPESEKQWAAICREVADIDDPREYLMRKTLKSLSGIK